jgi:hypothetical protein
VPLADFWLCMCSLYSPDLPRAGGIESDEAWSKAGLNAPGTKKRLVYSGQLAYYDKVKLLDRDTSASGVEARDDPDERGAYAPAPCMHPRRPPLTDCVGGYILFPLLEKGR